MLKTAAAAPVTRTSAIQSPHGSTLCSGSSSLSWVYLIWGGLLLSTDQTALIGSRVMTTMSVMVLIHTHTWLLQSGDLCL